MSFLLKSAYDALGFVALLNGGVDLSSVVFIGVEIQKGMIRRGWLSRA